MRQKLARKGVMSQPKPDSAITVALPFMGTDGSPDDLTIAALMAAFRDMQGQYGRFLSLQQDALGIDATEGRCLFFLASQGDNGATSKATGAFLGVTSGAMTALADRAAKAGYLERTVHPSDRRSIILKVTPAGAEVVETIALSFRQALSGIFQIASMPAITTVFRAVESALTAPPAPVEEN